MRDERYYGKPEDDQLIEMIHERRVKSIEKIIFHSQTPKAD